MLVSLFMKYILLNSIAKPLLLRDAFPFLCFKRFSLFILTFENYRYLKWQCIEKT